MQNLLLSIDNRGNNGRINDARHSRLWLSRRLRQLDEIQWGTLPFQSEAYVSLGTVTLRFPPYWFRPTAIMTTITFVITAWSMTHFIWHQHTIICLLALFLCLVVLWSPHYNSYNSHNPHILLSFSHTAQPESRLTFIWLIISLTPLFLLTQPIHFLCNYSIFTYNVLPSELLSVMATLVYIV